MRYTCLRDSQQQIHHKVTKHAHHVTVKSGLTLDSSHRVVISRGTCAFFPMSWCNRSASVVPSGSSFPTTSTVSTVSSGCTPVVAMFVTVATCAEPASESASVENFTVLVTVENYEPTMSTRKTVLCLGTSRWKGKTVKRWVQNHSINFVNPLNPELNPICYLLALLGAHHFLHVSRIRVKLLTLRLLMSYIYIYIWSAYS